MKKKLSVVVTTLALLLIVATPALAITNGQPDGGAHPYVGLVVFFDANGSGWRCSGSLITPTVFLTAGHCTDGAANARVYFEEVTPVPPYPYGGGHTGTPYTNPNFCTGCGPGLPEFAHGDVGIVVLDEAVDVGGFASLPSAGLVDTLKNKTPVDLVGYGVQYQIPGGPPSGTWHGIRQRMYAPSELVSGNFVHSDEFMRIALNPGGGSGGTCFGDSGGPILLGGTTTVLAVNSYVTNYNCSGVGYSFRVDTPDVLNWIAGFLS